MSGFLAKRIFRPLILAGSLFAYAASAQNSEPPVPGRAASFLPAGTSNDAGSYSGLAGAAPTALTPLTALSSPTTGIKPSPPSLPAFEGPGGPPSATQVPTPVPASIATPVSTAPLPLSSPAIGPSLAAPATITPPPLAGTSEPLALTDGQNPGLDIWTGTSRMWASYLLSNAVPTSSSELNRLMRRLLLAAASGLEGEDTNSPSFMAHRVDRLIAFGDGAAAWSLAKSADPRSIDDQSFRQAVDSALALDQDVCLGIADLAKSRPGADWQKTLVLCDLRTNNPKDAAALLDAMRLDANRDATFIDIADKGIFSEAHHLPPQLTPVTQATLALLRQTNLPLPNDLYNHPDTAWTPALLSIPAQQDVARLALAERAAERGILTSQALETIYRTVAFSPDALDAPLTSTESGLRLRALLFRAAEKEQQASKRIAYAVKFVQSASPGFLNGAANIPADMLGAVPADKGAADHPATVALIYLMAGRLAPASEWLQIASADEVQPLWPQFALGGLFSDTAYDASFTKWFDSAFHSDPAQADQQRNRDSLVSALLMLEAAGLRVPATAWVKVADTAPRKISISPLLFERLQAASTAGRRAETILIAVNLAGNDPLSLNAAVAVTRALRLIGLREDASLFARQQLALLMKIN